MEKELMDQVDSCTVESSIIYDQKANIAIRPAESSSISDIEAKITKRAVESSSISDQEAMFIKRGAESSGFSDQEAKISIRRVESFQHGGVKIGNGDGDEKLVENGDSGSLVPRKDDNLSCVIDVKPDEGETQRVCRICHLSKWEIGKDLAELIELGCGCKGELGFAHSHCAEAWFKLKGNRLCEICSKTAANITGVSNIEFLDNWSEGSVISTGPFASERRSRCLNGQPLCNFLLAFLVIVFVLPWFFRVNLF